jgi:hypothetical protein
MRDIVRHTAPTRSAWLLGGTAAFATGTAALVASSVALRLPFLGAPLTADEGGYAEIARLWAHGGVLYGHDWVDRPQGLILVFRGALALGLTSTLDLRLVGAAVAGLLAVAVTTIGSLLLDGRRGGLVAGLLATVTGASPFIDGFTLAGELVGAAVAAVAVALLAWNLRRERLWLLAAAGLLAGSAAMVKQSAGDAILTGAVVLACGRTDRIRRLAVFLAASAIPIVAAAVASGDPSAWYRAVVAYGANASPSLSARSVLFVHSLPAFAAALGPATVLAALGWRHAPRLLRVWLGAAVLGTCLGGDFHSHYYLQLVAPLALVGAAGVRALGRVGLAAACAAAIVPVALAAPLWPASGLAQAHELWPGDTHLLLDASVARYVRDHTSSRAKIYVVWAAADVYYLADRAPAYPYLWLRNLKTVHGALATVEHVLTRRTPALVVEAQPVSAADPRLRTRAILRRDYRPVARIGGDTIFRPRGT